MTGRRVHERFYYELPVTLGVGGRDVSAVTKNLSLGGMYILTDESIPFGAEVTLRFHLPALKEATECAATVRWVKADGVGVQFGSLRALEVWGLNQLFKGISQS